MPKARQAEGPASYSRYEPAFPGQGAAEPARLKDIRLQRELVDPPDSNRPKWPKGTALANDRLTVRDGLSVLAPLEDHLVMLLKGVQARLQSMKHRDGAIGLLSGLNQLVDDPFLPSNTILGNRDVSLGLGKVVLLIGVVHGGGCLSARGTAPRAPPRTHSSSPRRPSGKRDRGSPLPPRSPRRREAG